MGARMERVLARVAEAFEAFVHEDGSKRSEGAPLPCSLDQLPALGVLAETILMTW